MATLDDLVRDLLDRYAADGRTGPGLLRRLDDVAERTGQPREPGGRTPPGSRPPAPLDAVHWSQRIKTEAVALDRDLRGSPYPQPWEKGPARHPARRRGRPHRGDVARHRPDRAGPAQPVRALRARALPGLRGAVRVRARRRGPAARLVHQPRLRGRRDGTPRPVRRRTAVPADGEPGPNGTGAPARCSITRTALHHSGFLIRRMLSAT